MEAALFDERPLYIKQQNGRARNKLEFVELKLAFLRSHSVCATMQREKCVSFEMQEGF